MGKPFLKYLDGNKIYSCQNCSSHLSAHSEIISKNFHGRHGKAYLFNKAVNVITGPNEERPLITGLHIVCDIYCSSCKTIVGWKYEDAYEESQKYKIGKYILEKAKIKRENGLEAEVLTSIAAPSDSDSDDE